MNSLRDTMKDNLRQTLLDSRNFSKKTILVADEDTINEITYNLADVVFDVLNISVEEQDKDYD